MTIEDLVKHVMVELHAQATTDGFSLEKRREALKALRQKVLTDMLVVSCTMWAKEDDPDGQLQHALLTTGPPTGGASSSAAGPSPAACRREIPTPPSVPPAWGSSSTPE
jgi:hypothetical protein